jgi:hypothetical protein
MVKIAQLLENYVFYCPKQGRFWGKRRNNPFVYRTLTVTQHSFMQEVL